MAVSSLTVAVTRRVLGADRSLPKVLLLAQAVTVVRACVGAWTGQWLEVTVLSEEQGCWQGFRQ